MVLFATFCLANHRCNPRAMYIPYFADGHYRVDVRCQVQKIESGQEITVRYADALATTAERQAAARDKWSFECKCDR